MNSYSTTTHDDRCDSAGRLLVAAVVSVCVTLPGARLAAAADPAPSPQVSVQEARGTYTVTARFVVPQPPAIVLAVLSDYEEIPRFMPDVKRSVVVERAPGRLVVEQEAVSKFIMFSKQVHLLLEVNEGSGALQFVDRCGKSFKSYQGAWRVEPKDNGSLVTYELNAQPGFDVPEFVLKRLLKRDSALLVNRLRVEFAAKAKQTPTR
jgi:ribosome-associated toxin RatA of RatAB toxin-antitoxin module